MKGKRKQPIDWEAHVWGDGDGYEFLRRVGVRGLTVCGLCGTLKGVDRKCRGNLPTEDFYAHVKQDLRTMRPQGQEEQ